MPLLDNSWTIFHKYCEPPTRQKEKKTDMSSFFCVIALREGLPQGGFGWTL